MITLPTATLLAGKANLWGAVILAIVLAENCIMCINMQLSKLGVGNYFHLDAEEKLQVLERSRKVPTLFQILQQILS